MIGNENKRGNEATTEHRPLLLHSLMPSEAFAHHPLNAFLKVFPYNDKYIF